MLKPKHVRYNDDIITGVKSGVDIQLLALIGLVVVLFFTAYLSAHNRPANSSASVNSGSAVQSK